MIADEAEHFFKVCGIGGSYAQHAVRVSCHGVRLGYFWDAADHLPHSVWRHPTLAVNLDKGLDRPPQSRRLDFGCEAPDDAVVAKAIDSPLGGCCGQSDMMPEHGKAFPTVVGKSRKDLVIYFIKTQYSLLGFVDHTIGLALTRTLPFKGDDDSAEPRWTPLTTCPASALFDVPADLLRRCLFDQSMDGSERSC